MTQEPSPARPLAPPTEPLDGDRILERFLDYVAGQGLTLYPAQEEALFEILAGKHVVLATPTGSGKSLVATAFLYKALCEGKTGFYSCPVKALVNEKFFDLCTCFGPEHVGLVTGEHGFAPFARTGCRQRPGGVPLPSQSPGTRYPPLLAHSAAPGNGVQGRLRRRAKRAWCARHEHRTTR